MGTNDNLQQLTVDEQISLSGIESDGSTSIRLSSMMCALSALLLGCALYLSRGFFHSKGLFLTFQGVVVSGIAVFAPPIAFVLPAFRAVVIQRAFWVSLIAFAVGGAVFLHSQSSALRAIDVAIYERDSVRVLVHGANPYGTAISHEVNQSTESVDYYYGAGFFENGRVLVGFPYPPLTLFWMLPGYALGDIRWSFMVAVILSACCMFYLSANTVGLAAAIWFLFLQPTIYVLKYSWTEPLMVLMLALVVVAARKRPGWLPLALGLFFASKQYSLLALPLVALLLPTFSWRAYFRLLAKALGFTAIITLPFAMPDPHGFWRSLVDFQLRAPFRPDALSLSALLSRVGFHSIPQWFILSMVTIASGLCLWRSQRTASGFCASLGFVSLIFFF